VRKSKSKASKSAPTQTEDSDSEGVDEHENQLLSSKMTKIVIAATKGKLKLAARMGKSEAQIEEVYRLSVITSIK